MVVLGVGVVTFFLGHLRVEEIQVAQSCLDVGLEGFYVESETVGFACCDGVGVGWILAVEFAADAPDFFLVLHVVAEQLFADADGERAGAVECADHQRVKVFVNFGEGVLSAVLRFPEPENA